MKCKECIETEVVDVETLYRDHDMVKKGYIPLGEDDDGRYFNVTIWQCPNCKDIVIG